MAFIDFVEWSDAANDVFAWKFGQNTNNNLSTFTQLVVRESQEAVLFSKGQIIGKFGPGKHTLNTENLPLLRNLFGIPFGNLGKKNPFTAEVWFVNKAAPLTIDWRTDSMRYHDPDYNQMVPLAAAGRYGLKVDNAERFLVQLVGTLTEFNSAQLTDHFTGELVSKTKSVITSFMRNNGIGILTISEHLEELQKFLGQPLKEFWESYGMLLAGFYITSVDLDTSTEDGKKIAAALSDRSAQNIAGYTWQQRQGFGVAAGALSRGGDMGILGAAAMTGMLGGGGGVGQAMMQPPQQNFPGAAPSVPAPGRKEVFCAKCAKKYSTTSNFCPFCGNKYNPCPRCGSDNLGSSRRCVSCGSELAGQAAGGGFGTMCSRCGQQIQPNLKFCPNCGTAIS